MSRSARWAMAGLLPAAGVAVSWIWLSSLPSGAGTFAAVFGRLAVVACGLVALAAIGHALISGQGQLRRLETAGAAVALLGGLLAAVSIPPTPAPAGVPLLRDLKLAGQSTSVLVVPQRPGWNLVHVSGTEAAIGLDPLHLTAATPLTGATGLWTRIRLPAGPSRLLILHGGRQAALPVDTGHGVASGDGFAGPDGPECASVALGDLTAGADHPVLSCPDQELRPADGQALRGMIRFIAGRRVHRITLVTDSSVRSARAEREVRALAGQYGIAVRTPEPAHGRDPIVLVSGWQRADQILSRIAGNKLPSGGAYLAPWLLAGPLLSHPAGQLIPLRFDPRDPATLRYVAQLSARFPGELPTDSGYAAWLAAKGATRPEAVHLFAASQVFDPLEGGHSEGVNRIWLPTGAFADVSGALDGR